MELRVDEPNRKRVMNMLNFRTVLISAMCACLPMICCAQQGYNKDLRGQMRRLKQAQNAARAHHNRHQVHYLRGLIDRLQARINHRPRSQ